METTLSVGLTIFELPNPSSLNSFKGFVGLTLQVDRDRMLTGLVGKLSTLSTPRNSHSPC